MTTYADAGVNIELGDEASQVLYEAAKLTWKNRKGRLGDVIEIFDDFSGLRAINVGGLPEDTFMNLGFDGVGTKMELGERIGKHDTVAYDLFAMVCDDAVVRGAEPVIIGSILDVNTLGKEEDSHIDLVKQLAIGYVEAAKAANVAVINGEIAELGARVQGYGPFNYNWGAGVAWFARKSKLLTGFDVKVGDSLIGFKEQGFRSNGLSLVRRVLEKTHGPDWHEQELDGRSIAELALHPSTIYTATVMDILGGYGGTPRAEVHAIAHITGGGVPGKLGRALRPSGLGAFINDPFEPSELMRYCQEIGNVSDCVAYETWNMGQGMILATPEPEKVLRIAEEHTINAKVVGIVVKDPDIAIVNKGSQQKRSYLLF